VVVEAKAKRLVAETMATAETPIALLHVETKTTTTVPMLFLMFQAFHSLGVCNTAPRLACGFLLLTVTKIKSR
jgi:hypothetical protein